MQDIATDGASVYWTTTNGPFAPVVRKVGVSGGATTTIASEALFVNPQDCYWRIAVRGQNVYWSAGGTGGPISCAVKKVPIDGGAVLYWVDLALDTVGSIEKSAVNGTASYIPGELLLEPLGAFEAITVDGSGLYVTETQTGTINAVHRGTAWGGGAPGRS